MTLVVCPTGRQTRFAASPAVHQTRISDGAGETHWLVYWPCTSYVFVKISKSLICDFNIVVSYDQDITGLVPSIIFLYNNNNNNTNNSKHS